VGRNGTGTFERLAAAFLALTVSFFGAAAVLGATNLGARGGVALTSVFLAAAAVFVPASSWVRFAAPLSPN